MKMVMPKRVAKREERDIAKMKKCLMIKLDQKLVDTRRRCQNAGYSR